MRKWVPVLSGRMKAKFYHVAAPVLTSSVFREASLGNNTGRDLLGGKVNVFLDVEFTGRTDIPTIASGQGFAISFRGGQPALRAAFSRRSRRDRARRQPAVFPSSMKSSWTTISRSLPV